MTHPQIGALYTYWSGIDPNVLFIVTKINRIQVNLRRLDNGRKTISTRSLFRDRYIPLCVR